MIYQTDDTICAVSTPRGIGGIAVIRVSGSKAVAITDTLWRGTTLSNVKSHTAHYGEIIDPERPDTPLDQCVATVFKAPKSYTGEDTVEISVHGSAWIQRELIRLLIANGCRLAERGEFTRRALTHGRIDLTQAEGIADIIASTSRAAHRIAMSQMKGSISRRLSILRQQLVDISALLELELDFSEEDVEFADRTRLSRLATDIFDELSRLHSTFKTGNAIKQGIPVAIAGATNAGKSSLLNTLLQDDRAIVSDIHGTTRDTIEETLEIGDYLFRFIDTAGLRHTTDEIERIGIQRSHEAIGHASILLFVIDACQTFNPESLQLLNETGSDTGIIVINKTDVADAVEISRITQQIRAMSSFPIATISAKNGSGIEDLKAMIIDAVSADFPAEEDTIITNMRQAEALGKAATSTQELLTALDAGIPTDLVAQHLRETLSHLSSITGTIPSTEILNTIFSRFCIGK